MEQLIATLADFLNLAVTSKGGTALAAVLLSLLVWILTKVPAVKEFLAKDEKNQHVVMLVLAVVPAVVTTLSTKSSWLDAGVTAVMTFLAALGLGKVKTTLTE